MSGYYVAAFLLSAAAVLLWRWLSLALALKATMAKAAASPDPTPQRCDAPSRPIFAMDIFARYAAELKERGFTPIANSEVEHAGGGHRMWGYSQLYGSESEHAFAAVNQIAVPTRPDKGTGPSLILISHLADGRLLQTSNGRARWIHYAFYLPHQISVRNASAGTEQLLAAHRKNLEMVTAALHTGVAQQLTWEFWRAKIEATRGARTERKLAVDPYLFALRSFLPPPQRGVRTGDSCIPPNRFVLP